MSARFAIYLAPPAGSALEDFARCWLGRDHVTGATVPQLSTAGITPERLHEITASPRHYGFHATMKAPFTLAPGVTSADLARAAEAFAARQQPFDLALMPANLKGFLALIPKNPNAQLDALADACVREFEPLRAMLSADDIARRRRSKLSPRQDAQMLTFGYPYVFEDFHFHMTLTERLPESERDNVLAMLQSLTRELLAQPVPVHEIAIYVQKHRSDPFTLDARLPFATA